MNTSRLSIGAKSPLTGTIKEANAGGTAAQIMAKAGIKAIIQPGGSLRDDEVTKACDEHGIAMVFTGMRHFRH